jgi:hypothetical protein
MKKVQVYLKTADEKMMLQHNIVILSIIQNINNYPKNYSHGHYWQITSCTIYLLD